MFFQHLATSLIPPYLSAAQSWFIALFTFTTVPLLPSLSQPLILPHPILASEHRNRNSCYARLRRLHHTSKSRAKHEQCFRYEFNGHDQVAIGVSLSKFRETLEVQDRTRFPSPTGTPLARAHFPSPCYIWQLDVRSRGEFDCHQVYIHVLSPGSAGGGANRCKPAIGCSIDL